MMTQGIDGEIIKMKFNLKVIIFITSLLLSGCGESIDIIDQAYERYDSIRYKGWQDKLFIDKKTGVYFEYSCKPIHKAGVLEQRAAATHSHYKQAEKVGSKVFDDYIDKTVEKFSDEESEPSLFRTILSGLKAGNDYVNVLEKAEKHIRKNYGCKFNESDSILNTATETDSKKLKQLLKSGVNIDYQDEYGDTFLMSSITYENYAVAKWLIKNGANTQIQSKAGDTALTNLAHSENLDHEILNALLSKGSDINHQPESNYSLLAGLINSHSGETNRLADIELVLKKGANPNSLNHDGDFVATAICYLEDDSSYKPLIDLMVRYGLKLTSLDKSDKTLYEQEACIDNQAIITYLKSKSID